MTIMMLLIIVLLMILNVVVLSYNNINIRSNTIIRKTNSINLNVIPNTIPNTEDDSSELAFESSSSIKEKKEQLKFAQIEEEKKVIELQKASRDLLAKLENDNSKPSQVLEQNSITSSAPNSVPVVIPSSSSSPSPSLSEGLSTAKNSAFDAGLLIAFPVIVATLGLFFFFPFIRENLASSLPPLPSVDEMMQNK